MKILKDRTCTYKIYLSRELFLVHFVKRGPSEQRTNAPLASPGVPFVCFTSSESPCFNIQLIIYFPAAAKGVPLTLLRSLRPLSVGEDYTNNNQATSRACNGGN